MEGFHSKAEEAAASGDRQAETTPAHSKPSATAPPPGRLSQELDSLDLTVILFCPINFLWLKSLNVSLSTMCDPKKVAKSRLVAQCPVF